MTMKTSLRGAAALALMLPLGAMAEGLSYNYIEGGYSKATQENGSSNDFDYDGFYGAVSGKVAPNFYLFGDYRYYESDSFGPGHSRVDYDIGRIGAGFLVPLNPRLDLNAGGGALFAKFDFEGPASPATPRDNDDTGYFLQGGARALVLPNWEINGGFRYEKIFDDSETVGLVGTVFNFTPAFGVTGGYEFRDDFDAYTIGARFNFGV